VLAVSVLLGSFFRKHKVISRIYKPYEVECCRRVIKSVVCNFNLPYSSRFLYCIHYEKEQDLFFFSKNLSLGNISFFCFCTMRTRAVFGKIGFCRFGLKFLGEQGMLVGFQRASW